MTSLFTREFTDESGSADELESFIIGTTGDLLPEHADSEMARRTRSVVVKKNDFLNGNTSRNSQMNMKSSAP